MDLKKVDLAKLQDYAFTQNEIAMSRMMSWNSKFINIKCLANESIVPTVKAIPLDKVKQAREEIKQNAYPIVHGVNNHDMGMTLNGIFKVLDKLMESEE